MRGIDVADPYTERLMEGFAFLTSRVQMKMDAEFPRFSQRLLEMIAPNYLAHAVDGDCGNRARQPGAT
jgi:type VI secretion system protein ImpG